MFPRRASIHGLPDELLLVIFKIYTDDTSAVSLDLRHNCPEFLCLVSRKWYRIVYHTPALWTHIRYRRGVTFALRKSQALPLDITMTVLDDFQGQEDLEELCDHVHRWQTAWLSVSPDMLECLAGPAPLLETIYLKFTGSHNLRGSFDLFQGQAPRLRSVSLDGVAIPWSNGMLSGLQHLELENTPGSPGPTPEELKEILIASPRLALLKLHHVTIYEDTLQDDDSELHGSVPLPHLRSIHISETNALVAFHFFRLILSPPCQYFYVDFDILPEDIPFLNCLSPFIPRVHHPGCSATLRVEQGHIEYTRDDSIHRVCTIHLRTEDESLEQVVLRQLLQHVLTPDHCATETKVHFDDYKHPTKDVLEWLDAVDMLRVTELVITGIDRVLERLSVPQGDRWPFPNVSRIAIDVDGHVSATTPGALTRMVKARHQDNGLWANLPTPFASLRITDADDCLDEDFLAIRDILGPDRVQWRNRQQGITELQRVLLALCT